MIILDGGIRMQSAVEFDALGMAHERATLQ
jgi:hypothetical protein